jgi:hypothetical protein
MQSISSVKELKWCFCYLLICGHQLTKAGEITREKEEWTQIESNHATDYYWYIFYQTWLKATFVFKSIDRMICACFSCYSILAGYSNCIHGRPVRYTSAGCTWRTNTQSQLFRVEQFRVDRFRLYCIDPRENKWWSNKQNKQTQKTRGWATRTPSRPVRYTSAGCTWHTNTQSQLFRVGWVF